MDQGIIQQNKVRAVILAAGRGSRMGSLTDDVPKCLVEIKGRSLLDHQLDALHLAGISDIAVVTGYKADKIRSLHPNLTYFHNENWANTNMVASLAMAAKWLEQGPVIVSYSDIFYESSAVISLCQSAAPLAITYDVNWYDLWSQRFENVLDDAETFKLDKNHKYLIEIGNKAKSLSDIEGQYMGLLRFTASSWTIWLKSWQEIENKQRNQMHMTGMLQRLIENKQIHITAIPYDGYWGEVDSPTDQIYYQGHVDS
jgi:choline kinase